MSDLMEVWCSISYYELEHRVGEVFHVIVPSITVDGFTDQSCPTRFCLGLVSNGSRCQIVEKTLSHIGPGMRLCYEGGQVFVECLMEGASVFVQSANGNRMRNCSDDSVFKISPGSRVKVFSNLEFAERLSETVQGGFQDVYNMTKECHIRMSFIKGWGADYPRAAITQTPCWIEIRLNHALQWLNRVLMQMQPPCHFCPES